MRQILLFADGIYIDNGLQILIVCCFGLQIRNNGTTEHPPQRKNENTRHNGSNGNIRHNGLLKTVSKIIYRTHHNTLLLLDLYHEKNSCHYRFQTIL